MTRYEIKEEVEVEAGKMYQLTKDIVVTNWNDTDQELQKGQIVEIISANDNNIIFMEYYQTGNPNSFGKLKHEVDSSPDGQVQFEEFLSSIEEMSTADLDMSNLPEEYWPRKYLLTYIEFLHDQLQ